MASKQNFKTHFGAIKIKFPSFSPFNFTKQKGLFKKFSRFIGNRM